MKFDSLSNRVIGAALEVHRHLGPGLLESSYEECLTHELHQQRIQFTRQVPIPIQYKGICLSCGYRADLIVENLVLVELKSVSELEPIHTAQVLTYLRQANLKTGLLINFNVELLKQGLKRIVN